MHRVDAWYSGKNREFGGVIQALMDPAGEPLWVSDVLPGSTHDVTAARELVLAIAGHYTAEMPILAGCGYEGAGCGVLTPVPHRPDGSRCTSTHAPTTSCSAAYGASASAASRY